MRIEGTSGISGGRQPSMAQGADAESKNIQSQIKRLEQELQKLSENEDMSMEDKMKKRQEIQQEISALNIQLRQHQIAQRREERQNKRSSMDDMLGGTPKAHGQAKNDQGAGLSQGSMKAMISADSSMKQAEVQGNVSAGMEGRARVLKAEIKQDEGRGSSTEAKKEELARTEQAAMQAEASQINTLGKANAAMEEAGAAEQENKAAAEQKSKATAEQKSGKASEDEEKAVEEKAAEQGAEAQPGNPAVSVDIYL